MTSPQHDGPDTHDAAPSSAGHAAADLDQPAYRYNAGLAATIEQRWQDRWESEGTFEAPNPAGPWADTSGVGGRQKLYILDMFPYPSGAGLHVGHPLGYIATDVYGRFQRMCGYNVLHALGYDAFGLPAEQYAVQTGQHPRKTTEDNIVTMRRQLRRLGLAHDDRRSVATTDPEFVRWTQWMFLRIWNAWYDESAEGGLGRARHIDELVAEFAAGTREVPGGRPWADLTGDERYEVLDGYRLAYVSEAPVNWCPGLGTVLSNEEVTNEGRSERGNFPVFQRNLRQWMMRITAYADRLSDDLDRVDWPEAVKHMQRNWIGRSHGASVRFAVDGADDVEVFTTRPDTLFGATFVVLAPEHPLVEQISTASWPEGTKDAWTGGHTSPVEAVAAYRREASAKSDLERQSDTRDKTGVFTGAFAINPVDGRALPVFVADYVLMGYGTGAIMAVPGQDERDWDFAERFDLPIIRTVAPPPGWEGKAFTGDGAAINSSNDEISLDGLGVDEAKATIIDWLQGKGRGEGTVTYKLRDWLFSRQRYWGEPFPVLFDEQGHVHAVPDDQLPVELPEVPDYSPRTFAPDDADSDPEPPLGRVPEWVEVEMDLGDGPRRYRRETNTMPNWAGSCWYFLRYLDPANAETFCDPANEQYWMGPRGTRTDGLADPGGVDLYVGGVEHAVLHLLYARFWQKVMFDLGLLTSEEPFRRYFSQGMIQAYAYRDSRGQVVPATEVTPDGDGWSWNGQPVEREHGKMGKSLKNVVTPDEMYDSYGADTFRVYEMSMGPLDVSRPWETRAVVGSMRFLQRVWRNVVDETTGELTVVDTPADEADRRLLHRTIEAVRHDYTGLRFNTAVAKLIELNNALTRLPAVPRELVEPLVLMIAPVAPHLAEEVWSRLGHADSLTYQPFPQADPALLVEDTVTCVVQVQGKVRDRLDVAPSVSDDDLQALALASEKVIAAMAGREVRKVIVRAPGLVNIVPA